VSGATRSTNRRAARRATTITKQSGRVPVRGANAPVLRAATAADVHAIHTLISTHLREGHLLPRSVEDIDAHVGRFIVAAIGDRIVACADLAPLSPLVAEVRSLVVDEAHRGHRTGVALVTALADRARALGYVTLCAFTHAPSHFVRLGFSIVPHQWVPEKIAHDCAGCSHFRHCGQYAVSLSLRAGSGLRLSDGFSTAPRAVGPPRASVERLRLIPVANDEPERVPA